MVHYIVYITNDYLVLSNDLIKVKINYPDEIFGKTFQA